MPRPRRTFTREFEVQAVKLVTEQGDSCAESARRLGVRENPIRTWKKLLDAELGGANSGGETRPPPSTPSCTASASITNGCWWNGTSENAAAFFARECT